MGGEMTLDATDGHVVWDREEEAVHCGARAAPLSGRNACLYP